MASYYKVILDTSFLFLPFEAKIDIKEELMKMLNVKFDVYIPQCVLDEIKRIMNDPREGYKKRRMAKFIYEYVMKNFKILNVRGNVDDVLIDIGLKNENVIICTNDRMLRKKLKKYGIPTIYLHDYKLELDGYIK